MTIKIKETEYKAKELTGQHLFTFMEMADKLNINIKDINKAAGTNEVLTFKEFKEQNEEATKAEYKEYKSETTNKLFGLGIMTFLIKKSYKIKNEINALISEIYTMDLEVVKKLTAKQLIQAIKGAIQLSSVMEGINTFFQSEEVKK